MSKLVNLVADDVVDILRSCVDMNPPMLVIELKLNYSFKLPENGIIINKRWVIFC